MTGKEYWYQILDQLLLEIEAGDYDNAIFVLSGVLDGALLAGDDFDAIRKIICGHPIAHFLPLQDEDQANNLSIRASERADKACDKLAYHRALFTREELTKQATTYSPLLNQDICTIGSLAKLAVDNGADENRNNVLTLNTDTAASFFSETGKAIDTKLHKFDLIIAPEISDSLNKEALSNFIKLASQALRDGGRLLLSAFVPNHLGLGWRIICERKQLECHSPRDFQKLGAASGLSTSVFSDSSGCLVWGELKK